MKSSASTILIATQDVHVAVLIELGAILIGMQTAHINANDNIAAALQKFEENGAQITAIVADDKLGILPRHLNDVLCIFTKSIPPNVGLNYVKFEIDALVEPLSIDKKNREPSNTISYVFSNDNVYKMDNKVSEVHINACFDIPQRISPQVYTQFYQQYRLQRNQPITTQ